MPKSIDNLHCCVQRFVEALHQYQVATLQLNQAAHRQIAANRIVCREAKAIEALTQR